MNNKYFPPQYEEKSFHCPYCQVYADQKWLSFVLEGVYSRELQVCKCNHCDRYSYWYNESLIIPEPSFVPLPNEDIPEVIRLDYMEARSIVEKSPRGAAALLRLCLQKLMKELGETGKDINSDIGSLVKKGLPVEIQQALDIVRVIGNESVHPGELDISDDIATAIQLFELINFIVEDRITRRKKINNLFKKLPESKRVGIEIRDKEKKSEK